MRCERAARTEHSALSAAVRAFGVVALAITLQAPAHAGADPTRVLFLDDCASGCSYGPGIEDSRTNKSSLLSGIVAVPAYPYSTQSFDAVVQCVRDTFAPFAIEVTDVDPGNADHFEIAVGGSPQDIGFSPTITQVSPFRCGVTENGTGFVFPVLLGSDTDLICGITALTAGTLLGLDHELLAGDVMSFLAGPYPRDFLDQSAACGELQARNCVCGGTTQNSFQQLLVTLPEPTAAANVLAAVVGLAFAARRRRRSGTTVLGILGAAALLAAPGAEARVLLSRDVVVTDAGELVVVDAQTGAVATIALDARFESSRDLAIEPGRTIAVLVDGPSSDPEILRVHPASGVVDVVSSGGQLLEPTGIAVDAGGDLIVSDASGLYRVDPITGAQQRLSLFTCALFPASDVEVDADGNYLFACPLGATPGVVRRSGTTLGLDMLSTGGVFGSPTSLALARDGEIFVSDPGALGLGGPAVISVDPGDGDQTVVSAGGNLSDPLDLAVLEFGGDVLVTDSTSESLIRVDPAFPDPLFGSNQGLLSSGLTPRNLVVVPEPSIGLQRSACVMLLALLARGSVCRDGAHSRRTRNEQSH